MRRANRWIHTVLVMATVACAWLTATKLHVSGDLSALLPNSGESTGLARWVRAFGGLGGGVRAAPGGVSVADEGRARLVVAEAHGSAFSSSDARAVVDDVERAMAEAARPGVTTELTGGHAVARATEQMLRRDLAVSGALSIALASLAFVVTFRRTRALVAVLPPLALGTLWTTGLAALLPAGLSAVAIAFAAVVVGVGVDTGVHVYAALLAARRGGHHGAHAPPQGRPPALRPPLAAPPLPAGAFSAPALHRASALTAPR